MLYEPVSDILNAISRECERIREGEGNNRLSIYLPDRVDAIERLARKLVDSARAEQRDGLDSLAPPKAEHHWALARQFRTWADEHEKKARAAENDAAAAETIESED